MVRMPESRRRASDPHLPSPSPSPAPRPFNLHLPDLKEHRDSEDELPPLSIGSPCRPSGHAAKPPTNSTVNSTTNSITTNNSAAMINNTTASGSIVINGERKRSATKPSPNSDKRVKLSPPMDPSNGLPRRFGEDIFADTWRWESEEERRGRDGPVDSSSGLELRRVDIRPLPSRTLSTPPARRRAQSAKSTKQKAPAPLDLNPKREKLRPSPVPDVPSPMPATLPLPPLSIPTFLQLELASDRPSPLYIHRSAAADIAYESSAVKFERLLNFLLLPPQLERVLWFGAVACFDAWLYTFTILPLRFLKAVGILVQWWMRNAWKELCDLVEFVYVGLGRLWRRRNTRHRGRSASSVASPSKVVHAWPDPLRRKRRHRRTRSTPSLLQSSHKADILKGLLVLISCCIMMRLDPSRMYHNIRGQAAIKLYVIYNVLEVADRLLSAIGQDVLECLCSSETLDRGSDGRSKVIRPFWMFIIALVYNVIHASALLYQVITLNVAVNSYSNALLTLLMSNQFVEIKGTVFKKFEKENLFQLTCADVVERFQLWLMLLIIAMRNIVEVGGLAVLGPSFTPPSTTSDPAAAFTNATRAPLTTASILPKSFTILPRWTGQVLGPFLIVLGSEMLVDWLKHAYINKFNNTRPAIYGRFLDVLAKDYYTHAFADQNLTKRLGLPVIPLACLFIRAAVQTYQMFAAMYVPAPRAPLAGSATSSATTTAAIARFDALVHAVRSGNMWDAGAVWAARIVFFLVVYLLLLGAKLVLGMALLGLARRRYRGMKERERTVYDAAGGRRFGDIGMVEVDEDKRRWIAGEEKKEKRRVVELAGVDRYAMVAKRIW